ncbi:hypothetical protein QBC39DRAFT_425079 [Podospora conica]|nr:hypothetical protein QBC39DRAFT_425079 [Schizothecium conicum]
MRLININTLEMKEFFEGSTSEASIPPYAILSHTWGSEEITKVDGLKSRAGYRKILDFCGAPHWAWVDTCCIDKTSSAELSEAINSMFKWYKRSEVCLVYLSDVPTNGRRHSNADSEFRCSRWFTRGWTLQELLAPSRLWFYNQAWFRIGVIVKSDRESHIRSDLSISVAKVTGIPVSAITCYRGLSSASVSSKMSWAAKRETTRIEDTAYCMLGLFGVHMPLLYGEGRQSFTRLQEHIIMHSVDHTIFAWRYGAGLPDSRQIRKFNNLMAQSPSDFVRGSELQDSSSFSASPKDTSFQMTNRGLHIRLPILLLRPWPYRLSPTKP